MRATRFIFVEGIMGTGKTTAVYSLVLHLRKEGIGAQALWEGPTLDEPDHSLRLAPTLPHPLAPWHDLSAEEFAEESLRRWRRYAARAADSDNVTVCDGLLFHGNMTDLMLMGTSPAQLKQYVAAILSIVGPLNPVLIYLRRSDLAVALRQLIAERGNEWQAYQLGWKLSSPLAKRRNWQGMDGFITLYTAYRALCDRLFRELLVPKLLIRHDDEWDAIYAGIADFLDLPAKKGLFARVPIP